MIVVMISSAGSTLDSTFTSLSKLIANNGAAGMPNFSGSRFGILTRIGRRPAPHGALYGLTLQDVHVDALAIRYDHAAWQKDFLANWPPGSPAWLSYFKRIVDGPDYALSQARAGESADTVGADRSMAFAGKA